MSQPERKVHHVFDDIVEEDNHMPRWWVGLFWVTIVFAFAYWFAYHVAGDGTPIARAYEAHAAAAKAQALAAQPSVDDDGALERLAKDAAALAVGQATFQQNCASCHGPQGQGIIGPNLTDAFWLHGAKATAIHAVVEQGKIDKGMPGWGPVLGAERIRAVTAYVLTLKGKNLPGRPPQGDPSP